MSQIDHVVEQLLRLARTSEKDFFRAPDPGFVALHTGAATRETELSRKPFARLLVAVDFSSCSKSALRCAAALARCLEPTSVVLLHVLKPVTLAQRIREQYPSAPHDGDSPLVLEDRELVDLLAEQREKSYTALQFVVPQALMSDKVELRVLIGEPAERVLAAAAEIQADLLIMGSHGRTGLERVVMGSVAESVTRRATCPVITVKE